MKSTVAKKIREHVAIMIAKKHIPGSHSARYYKYIKNLWKNVPNNKKAELEQKLKDAENGLLASI